MICVTLQNHTLEEILDILDNRTPAVQMAEIRLDRCPLDLEAIEELFSSSDTPLVATCRVAGDGNGTWEEAETRLMAAIEAGAAFVDLEIEAPKETGKRLRRACSEFGTRMIRSCHFFDGTPSTEILAETAERCRRFGGEITKVVATAGNEEDASRILSLYDTAEQGRLIAFAMGEKGRMSRLECLRKGAPFTYSALTAEEGAAPGQWPYDLMYETVFGNRKPLGNGCTLEMPASKSFAQRAVIAAALASSPAPEPVEGPSVLRGYSPCGDNESAVQVARSLGAEVIVEGSTLTVTPVPFDKLRDREDGPALHVGESGLLTRLMIPLVAALNGDRETRITGEGTLPGRPLKGASEIMARFGTVLRPLGEKPEGEIKVPLTVQGPLLPGKADISGKDGSQLISGLLMALPLLPSDSTIHVHDPKSIPYMFITVDVLRKFGIRIGSEMEGDEEFMETQDWGLCTGITFKIKGGQEYHPASFDIEGDWSAAANFLVAGAVFGKVQLEGLDTTSLQADISIMDILMDAGASLSQMDNVITVQRAPLRSFETDLNNCPDLFPAVSVLAAFCNGESRILGFRRLAGKESDRGDAILETLSKMGVNAYAEGDCLTIGGQTLESRILNGRLLKGGDYSSFHDHRMAMALTVASLGADGEIFIDDTGCVAKSFPAFFDSWDKISRPED